MIFLNFAANKLHNIAVPSKSHTSLFPGSPTITILAYSKAKLKRNDNKASHCFRLFWAGNKYLWYLMTLVRFK
jgi:hypothetical protein